MTKDPFVEKYRPTKIDDVLLSESDKNIFRKFIEEKNIPHLLFHGSAGVGKTTVAKILAKSVTNDVLFISASSDTSIDVIRGKVNDFCSTISFNDELKVVILDEVDFMSSNSHAMLRNVLEDHIKTARFILTCNYINKIIEPIQSRTQIFKFKPLELPQIGGLIHKIKKEEGIKVPDIEELRRLILHFYPDVRKTINQFEKCSSSGVFSYKESGDFNTELLLSLLKAQDFNAIRTNVVGSADYGDLYKALHDNAEKITKKGKVNVRLIAGEYMWRHSTVIDQEINFMNCIDLVMQEIGKDE